MTSEVRNVELWCFPKVGRLVEKSGFFGLNPFLLEHFIKSNVLAFFAWYLLLLRAPTYKGTNV